MKYIYIITILASVNAIACTTFASFNGENNSFIMAKNRDNNPDNQVIEVVAQPNKFKYLALSRKDVPDFVSVGVNEHNLAVFNEVTIEYSNKATGGIADDFSKDILQNYTTATAVIPDIPKLIKKYPDPVFYQVSDGLNLLSIEVAPNHKYQYSITTAGSFAHTNNYQESQLIKNYPYTTSEKQRLTNSQTRYNRALNLLNSESKINLVAMQNIGLDRNAGNDDSIFRTGANPTPRTSKSLAFFVVELNKHDSTVIQANLYSVGEKYQYILTPSFWQSYASGITILKPNSK
jgi:hypothetical protein